MTRGSKTPVSVELPSPTVRFAPDFLERLGRLTMRVAGARERSEGAGHASLVGVGSEFVGYRPYRPGEDLRALDWSLFARMRRPFVRVSRREASEHWAVLVDASASMGVGVPGKLQRAAEIATAIAAIGCKEGARVELFVSGAKDTLRLSKRHGLGAWMRALERARASGASGLAQLVSEPTRLRRAGAVFLVGDLLDLEPKDALRLARRGRDLFVIQILAEEELTPPAAGPVRWVDAEAGTARTIDVDATRVAEYGELLSGKLEAWGKACAMHRAKYRTWATGTEFETVVQGLFEE